MGTRAFLLTQLPGGIRLSQQSSPQLGLGCFLLRLGKKKPLWQEGTGIQRADPSQIPRVRGNSHLGDKRMVGLRQRAADT